MHVKWPVGKLFIVALHVIAKDRKWLKCPLMRDWFNKLWLIHTVDYYAGIKKEILYIVMVMISKLFCKMKIVNICGKKGSHANIDINMCIYFLLYAFNIPRSIHKKRQMPLEWQVGWQRDRSEGKAFHRNVHWYLLTFEPGKLLQIYTYIHAL